MLAHSNTHANTHTHILSITPACTKESLNSNIIQDLFHSVSNKTHILCHIIHDGSFLFNLHNLLRYDDSSRTYSFYIT